MEVDRNDSQLYMDHVSNLSNDSIETKTIYTGEIVTVDNDFAYVNIGTKTDGRVSLEEFETAPQVGDVVEVMLMNKRLLDGMYVFSIKAAKKEKSWMQFLKAIEGTNIIQGTIKQKSKTGFVVDCNGVQAFLPLTLATDVKGKSQNGHAAVYFKIKSIDRKKRSVLLSRKDFLDEEQKRIWDNLEANYKPGDVLRGKVTKFVDFGAFVDIGGVEALLHRNDISWRKVFKKKKILKIGEERDFVLLAINRVEGKIALGLKQLVPDPWLSVPEKYPVGTVIEGKIVTIINFGMFIEVEPGIEGYCAAADISWAKRTVNPKELYKKGDKIQSIVLNVDIENRKLLLGVKQLQPNPWDTIEKRFPVKSVHTRPVKKVVNFGLFVELEPDIDGLIRISDISWDENFKDIQSQYKEGQEVQFIILEIKKEEQKIACGIKQLAKSPWEEIAEKYPPRTIVSGSVTGIAPFGMFVKIDGDTVEGLVHVSEVSRKKIESIDAIYKVGDKVNAIVLGVDVDKKRLSLSIKHYEIMSEKEEIKKILNTTMSGTVTLGELLKNKLDKE